MKYLNKLFFTLFFFVLALSDVCSQSFVVEMNITNYQSDTVIVGNYYGDKQIVKDTLLAKSPGKFIWKEDQQPEPGMYLALLKPTNTFIQFLVSDHEHGFQLSFDPKDLMDIKFKNSKENAQFYQYMDFLKDKRIIADTLRAKIERAKTNITTDEVAQNELDKLDNTVKNYQGEFMAKYPKSMTSLFIKSNVEVDIPEFTGTEDSVRYKKYFYYKDHFFDNIDMSHPALIRTPFIHPKVDYFINKLSNQQPDSLIKSVDFVLSKLEHNTDAYKYYLADFLNKYAQMKTVGQDAIYVHLVDQYYTKGKATWLTEENLGKMVENADELRPILIGKIMPDFTTYLEDGRPINLHSVASPYTVVIFWAPDCGHCKKIMPDVVSFYQNNKAKGVKMFSVCTKGGENTKTCWPAVKEKGMDDFINTADEYQRYHAKIKIKSTPKIFILDEKKEIIIKDIPGEELDRIFNEILSFEEKKNLEKG